MDAVKPQHNEARSTFGEEIFTLTGLWIGLSWTRDIMQGGAIQALSWTLIEQAQLSDNKVNINGCEDYPILRFEEATIIDVGILARKRW